MSRTTKVIGFSVAPAIAQKVEKIAQMEHRTKSELFREMFRVWLAYRRQQDREMESLVNRAVREVREEVPMSPKAQAEEEAELLRYGEAQAKKLGIKEKDVPRLIKEERAKRRLL